jgi:hypothetical protein
MTTDLLKENRKIYGDHICLSLNINSLHPDITSLNTSGPIDVSFTATNNDNDVT